MQNAIHKQKRAAELAREGNKHETKNDTNKERMEVHERLKPWSLLFSLNGFTHELIGPQIINILLITWDQTMSQEMLKIFIIGPKIFRP